MPRLVVQRGADGNGRLYLSGRFTGVVDKVEAQLTPVAAGQGVATVWQTVQANPTNQLFLGYITGAGGWYVLTVRTLVGSTVIEQASVQPVGIGEVFITAGQSNSRGLGIGDNDLGTRTDRVNAIDSINHYYPAPPAAPALLSSGDPSPVPVFKALTAGRRVFPMAESSWGWGELGDYIVNRYNVPVAFFVAGWDGSTIDNWQKTANGIPACNAYNCVANWENLQPYTNLKNVLQYYGSVSGVRSILWHQGEAEGDVAREAIPTYADRLRDIIQKTRQDFGGRNVPWMLARASFNGQKTTPEVVTQQENVIATSGFNVFQGPYNDTIQNRNAGSIDVHFRNVERPTTDPQYYLNTTSVPVNMGLSRFARNWNNSMTNAFFQNAKPVTPIQFAVTGNLATYVLPGATLPVSFSTLGTFNSGNIWQVQLLDSLGQYKSVLGSGTTSPISVTLPAALQSGRYQVRVVASSPAMPAVPSNLFQITQQADLSLAMGINLRTPSLNTPVTISLFVRNAGPGGAKGVVVRNRLPNNLEFVSSTDLVVNEGVLTSVPIDINPGATQILRFMARPTASGTYQNAAEIAQAATIDLDSQPNSGTGDGQDDAAQLDFRTSQGSAAVFTSPNPNQVPLPAVSSNQPAPNSAKADVSLSMSVNTRTPGVGDTLLYTLTITNQGGLAATGLSIAAYLPASQTFVPGNDFALSGGVLVGGVSSLAAGARVSLQFKARASTSGQGVCTAQVQAASVPDPDSVPGNGTTNGEDDTAQIDVRVR
ncbi:sialate O-acetylesterase [Spirosoma pollinicola]|nr:sialate O-acetylesterase [Spirosoma pollinicola]